MTASRGHQLCGVILFGPIPYNRDFVDQTTPMAPILPSQSANSTLTRRGVFVVFGKPERPSSLSTLNPGGGGCYYLLSHVDKHGLYAWKLSDGGIISELGWVNNRQT